MSYTESAAFDVEAANCCLHTLAQKLWPERRNIQLHHELHVEGMTFITALRE